MEAASGEERNIYNIRVALVSTGLSHIQRGYETFIQDLYETLKDVGSVTLFKGSGWSAPPNIYTVPALHRNSPWTRRLAPDSELKRYRYEQLSFALVGWMNGYWQNFDVIHFCDPAFGNALVRMRKLFKYRYKLLFANCGPAEPEDYTQFDYIQEFTPTYLEKARQQIRKTRLFLIPMGVWVERFNSGPDRQMLRTQYGLPQDKLVVLCVASLDEPYKRQDFLINAMAELDDPDLFLLLVGQNQDSPHARQLLALAQEKLPGRFKYQTVPYASVPEVYQASDLFVLPSLNEGFGKVYLEAMAARLPLLCHDSANTQWIVRDPRCHINMEHPEALKQALASLHAGPDLTPLARDMADTNYEWVRQNYHWYRLRGDYIRMYEQMLILPA